MNCLALLRRDVPLALGNRHALNGFVIRMGGDRVAQRLDPVRARAF